MVLKKNCILRKIKRGKSNQRCAKIQSDGRMDKNKNVIIEGADKRYALQKLINIEGQVCYFL